MDINPETARYNLPLEQRSIGSFLRLRAAHGVHDQPAHDLGHAGLVVGPEQRRSVGGDDGRAGTKAKVSGL